MIVVFIIQLLTHFVRNYLVIEHELSASYLNEKLEEGKVYFAVKVLQMGPFYSFIELAPSIFDFVG